MFRAGEPPSMGHSGAGGGPFGTGAAPTGTARSSSKTSAGRDMTPPGKVKGYLPILPRKGALTQLLQIPRSAWYLQSRTDRHAASDDSFCTFDFTNHCG